MVRARLGAERAEDRLEPLRMLPRLLQVLVERVHKPLGLRLLAQLGQHLEGERALRPVQLGE